MIYDRSLMEKAFMIHTRLQGGACICGWRKTTMNRNYIDHVLDIYEEWVQVAEV